MVPTSRQSFSEVWYCKSSPYSNKMQQAGAQSLVCHQMLLPAADLEHSKDRQTKACGITLVIIAIMTIYVLGTQLDGCNH
jgi:hypothetical protein